MYWYRQFFFNMDVSSPANWNSGGSVMNAFIPSVRLMPFSVPPCRRCPRRRTLSTFSRFSSFIRPFLLSPLLYCSPPSSLATPFFFLQYVSFDFPPPLYLQPSSTLHGSVLFLCTRISDVVFFFLNFLGSFST